MELQNCRHRSWVLLCFHQQCIRVPVFLYISPALVIITVFDNSHLSGGKVLLLCGFDLHFPKNWWTWASFPILSVELYCFCSFMIILKGGKCVVSRGMCHLNSLLVKAFSPQWLRGHLLQSCPPLRGLLQLQRATLPKLGPLPGWLCSVTYKGVV